MRSIVKRVVMWTYCRRLLPARAVAWIFRVMRLRRA